MTIATTDNTRFAEGDGGTTDFDFTFLFFEDATILVYVDGVLQVLDTDYTLTNDDPGGTVSFTTAPPDGDQVLIKRVEPLTQDHDYIENDDFPAESHEVALDRVVMMVQQLQEELNRSITLPETDDSAGDLPNETDRADKFLYFDENGDFSAVAGTPETAKTYEKTWGVYHASQSVVAEDPAKTWIADRTFTLKTGISGLKAWVITASTSGAISIDVEVNGTSILDTNITIDQDDQHSDDATTPVAIDADNLVITKGDVIEIITSSAGTGAAGLYVTFIGTI